ncbi:hypothetical protein KSC_047450 [Ktedonobacter sp. SOSP1-52]|nr:hypothetical protein KSC_047450 [Ktedonobacter sp. SOSP1-52]
MWVCATFTIEEYGYFTYRGMGRGGGREGRLGKTKLAQAALELIQPAFWPGGKCLADYLCRDKWMHALKGL